MQKLSIFWLKRALDKIDIEESCKFDKIIDNVYPVTVSTKLFSPNLIHPIKTAISHELMSITFIKNIYTLLTAYEKKIT